MNRRDLIRHLANMNCERLREGGNHAIDVNPQTGHRAGARASGNRQAHLPAVGGAGTGLMIQ